MPPKDIRALKAFFEENKFLTNMELAQKAGVSTKTIQIWKRKCGIKLEHRGWGSNLKERPFKGVYMKPRPLPEEPVTDDSWRKKEWLEDRYLKKGYSITQISKLVNRHRAVVWHKLVKYGIPLKSHEDVAKSENRCQSRKWLEDHYEILGMTLTECAELAGVNIYTIMNWLVKFAIPIRDTYECQYGERSVNYGKKKIAN